jgi:ribonuclease D
VNNIIFIDDNIAFSSYCETLVNKPVFALDTEFLRVNTFYPKPGLFQLNDGEQVVLVDPCAITDWKLFKAILVNPSQVKVLHACDEDIELLYHFLHIEPQNVFDTQVAAAFCGYDFCMGYQRLLKAMLDIDLEKGMSRSDWMQRPLTEEQIEYAADDVRYLLTMYQHLVEAIEARDLLPVIHEEYQSVVNNITSSDFESAYVRIKDAWKLTPKQFSIVRALATWRENMMREYDIPRKRIATDEALMILAQQEEWSATQLFSVSGLASFVVRNVGEDIIAIIERAAKSKSNEKAMKPIKGDPFYHQLKKLLEKQAKTFGVEEKMLSKKQFNEQLYWQMKKGDFTLPENITGWRKPFYEKVVSALAQA